MVDAYKPSSPPGWFPSFFFHFSWRRCQNLCYLNTVRTSETNSSNSFWTQNCKTAYFCEVHIEFRIVYDLLYLISSICIYILLLWTEQSKYPASWNILVYWDDEEKQGKKYHEEIFFGFLQCTINLHSKHSKFVKLRSLLNFLCMFPVF